MKKMQLIMSLILVTFLSNCGKDDKSDPNQVGANGGTVVTSDAAASITIPPGALGANTTISITPTTSHPTGSTGTVYDFGPSGTQFSSPVTIIFNYKDADIVGAEANMQMAYVDNGKWVTIPSTVDAANNKLSGTVNHFTNFGIVPNLLVGTWLQTNKTVTNCGLDNSPTTSCSPNCQTMTYTTSALIVSGGGRATENYTYLLNGNAIITTPVSATVSLTYSITNTTLTITAVSSCTTITTWIKQ